MGLTVSDSGGYTPAPAGTHVAVCIGYCDLGTQKSTFEGKEKIGPKVRLMWELSDEKRDDGKPVTTGKTYSNSLGDRASLRQHLESWRGKPFTADELKGFDLDKIVGAPCMLTIIHKPKQSGGVTDSISGITPLHKSIQRPVQITPSIKFVIADWNAQRFAALPQFLQKIILLSPEGQRAHAAHGGGAPNTAANGPNGQHEPGGYEPDTSGDIPF